MNETESQRRRRWITIGEMIALLALVVSALGVWISWKSSGNDKPARIVEQRPSIPLMLRGRQEFDGQKLEISPVEPSHALESLIDHPPRRLTDRDWERWCGRFERRRVSAQRP